MNDMINKDPIFQKSKEVWEDNLILFPETKLNYPDEMLVRLFSARYIYVPSPPAKVMDHGFGHGNNLLFSATKGYECAGCEISEYLIQQVNRLFKKFGKKVDLRLINGLDIPFENNYFDIVVSWNVIHYNGTRSAVQHVISELYRVLKTNGILLLSTLHPDNALFNRMEHISNGSYKIVKKSDYDNRQGLTFFATKSPEELKEIFSLFSTVKIGSVYYDLFNTERRYASFLIYGVK